MATTYRRRRIIEPQASVPLDPLRGLQLMRRKRASAVHTAGDRVLSHGRRILATVGLHGAEDWHIPDVEGGGATRVYPTSDDERVVLRTPAVALTPGHFVRVMVVASLSGQTQLDIVDAMGDYKNTGPRGIVRVAVTYDNGSDSETITKDLSIPTSNLQFAAQPTGPGAAWSRLQRRHSSRFLPADMTLPANLAAWCDGVTVSLVVSYVGSPRAIDVVVYEEPYALAYDIAVGDFAAPMHAAADGGNLGQLVGPVPVTKASAGDARGGAEVVCDAAARLCQELGPVLLFASSWDESNQSVTEAEAEYKSVTGTTYSNLIDATTTTWTASSAGWSPVSGANARRVQDCETSVVLRDTDNVVPVRCHVFGSLSTLTGSPTATVRFEAAAYSIAEVSVPVGTSDAWHSAPGHLRCGLGAQDPVVLQVRARTSTAGSSFRWRYLLVVFEDL